LNNSFVTSFHDHVPSSQLEFPQVDDSTLQKHFLLAQSRRLIFFGVNRSERHGFIIFFGGALAARGDEPGPAPELVFAVEIEKCEECGGEVKIIACVEDERVIGKILGCCTDERNEVR
jgi:hypothetical protein